VSFAAITLYVASQRVFVVVVVVVIMSFSTQSGNFWIHPRILQIYMKTYFHTGEQMIEASCKKLVASTYPY
jgi:hypothetical protein